MRDFSGEIFFRTARSGGKGGQNVNKVETMAEAWWHIPASAIFTPEEKQLIRHKLQNRINKDGYLIVKSSESRSQLENKHIAKEKMLAMVAQALIVPKLRKASRPTKGMIERRLENKRRASETKQMRRNDFR